MSKNEKLDIDKYESLEWSDFHALPKENKKNLIAFVAKTTLPTIHFEDLKEGLKSPVRVISKAELQKNAQTLIGGTIGFEHQAFPIYGGYVIDAKWNEKEEQIEGVGIVPDAYIEKVRSGKIKKCSVTFNWQREIVSSECTEFVGVRFPRVDLLDVGTVAGDRNTSVSLFESTKQEGFLEGSIISENLPLKIESLPSGSPKPDESLQKIKDLEGAVHTLKESMKTIELARALAIETAKKAESQRIVKEIKEILPAPQFERYFNNGAKMFTEEVKKIVRKEESLNIA